MHGTGFTTGSLARVGARGEIKVSSKKELTEFGRMVMEGEQGKSIS